MIVSGSLGAKGFAFNVGVELASTRAEASSAPTQTLHIVPIGLLPVEVPGT